MFNINGEDWKILFVSSNHPALVRSDGSRTIGATEDITKSIYIYEGLAPRKLLKVLCHEITHAAMFSYNVELSLDQEELLADLVATYGQEIVDKTNTIFRRIRENREP